MPSKLLFALFALLTAATKAQNFSIYQNINTSNGLISNYVFTTCEDDNGFLWVGTDKGICMYDGFRWQQWDKDRGLPGNYVNLLLPDGQGGLWMGIGDKGYFHFTREKGITHQLMPGKRLHNQTIQVDRDGKLLMEVDENGVYNGYMIEAQNPARPRLIYSVDPNIGYPFRANARNKRLYVVTDTPFDTVRLNRGIKSRWPLRTLPVPQDQTGLANLYYVNDTLVITSSNITRYNQHKKELFTYRLFQPGNTYGLNCITKGGQYVYDIKTGYYFIDNNGNKKFFNRQSGLGAEYVNNIYETRDGTIIISTLGAGLQLIKHNYRQTFTTNDKAVRSITRFNDRWYLLADSKVYYVDDDNEKLQEAADLPNPGLCMFQDGNDFFVGSLKGIYQFKIKGDVFACSNYFPVFAGVSSFIKQGDHFVAGTYGSGIIRFTLSTIDGIKQDFPMRIVEKLVDYKGGFAALSYEDGAVLTDQATDTHSQVSQKNGLLSNSVYNLQFYDDTFYISTKKGVSLFSKGKVCGTLPFDDGARNENAIYCFKDRKKQLWVVSNRYLYHVVNKALKPVGTHNLVDDDDVVSSACYNAATDELAIGSTKTFSIVNIDAVKPDTNILTPALIDVFADGKEVKTSQFKVPYYFHSIECKLAPAASTPFAHSRYLYRLAGRDDGWQPVKDSLTLSFAALRPGNYRLFVKIINGDGYESKPKLLTSFSVLKPFWQRWPFLLACIVVTALLTIFVMQQYEKQKRRKKDMKLMVQQSLQAERERISKDLHDHLGANLATIIAQADNIESKLYKGDVERAANTVQSLSLQSRETLNVLRETIWAVQETEHPIHDFIVRMSTYLQRHFEATTITWELVNEIEDSVILSPTQTLHVFRVVQEASQNIIKHSGATHAMYKFAKANSQMLLVITDNGRGFNEKITSSTNGLNNIYERAKILNGTVEFTGDKGATLSFAIPLNTPDIV